MNHPKTSGIRATWIRISVILCVIQPISSITNTINVGKYMVWHLCQVKKNNNFFLPVRISEIFQFGASLGT